MQIVNEKLEIDAQPKVEAFNHGYKRGGGNVQIVNDKVEFDAAPKVNHLNPVYKKGGGNIQVSLFKKGIFYLLKSTNKKQIKQIFGTHFTF